MSLSLGLPISMNPCENIKAEIDEKIHDLEQQSVILRTKIAKLRNELMIFQPGDISAVHIVDGAIAAISTDDFDAGATALTQIQNFAGSCADSVFNGMRKYAANLESWMNDSMSNATSFSSLPEFNALGAFREYKDALGTSAVSSLLADIDEKLGCLAGQGSELSECLSLFDHFNDRVEDLLKYMGLSEAGTLDLFSFVAGFGINIPRIAELIDNINTLDEKMVSLQTEIEGNIEKAGEFIANAQGKVTSSVQDWF
jgi:hypothetical protein